MIIDTQIKLKALNFYYPDGGYIITNGVVDWIDNSTNNIPEEQIQAKIAELEAAEPLRLLRIERDRKLTEVDWWTSRALDGTPLTTGQTAYRQALRDLPENSANVAIDENGTLINVEWPVKPE